MVSPAHPSVPVTANASGPAEPLADHPIVTTAWGWRIGAVAVLVALGLCLTFLLDGKTVYGVLWAAVTLGWGFFVVKLHRRHEGYVRSL